MQTNGAVSMLAAPFSLVPLPGPLQVLLLVLILTQVMGDQLSPGTLIDTWVCGRAARLVTLWVLRHQTDVPGCSWVPRVIQVAATECYTHLTSALWVMSVQKQRLCTTLNHRYSELAEGSCIWNLMYHQTELMSRHQPGFGVLCRRYHPYVLRQL